MVADLASGTRATELGTWVHTASILADSCLRTIQVGNALRFGFASCGGPIWISNLSIPTATGVATLEVCALSRRVAGGRGRAALVYVHAALLLSAGRDFESFFAMAHGGMVLRVTRALSALHVAARILRDREEIIR